MRDRFRMAWLRGDITEREYRGVKPLYWFIRWWV